LWDDSPDDSRRLRQTSSAYSPGHSLSVINRAGLAVLADRLSQSRSQLRGRSPLLTRILLSIPARPDCCCTQQSSIQRHALSASQSQIPPSRRHCHSPFFHSLRHSCEARHETKRTKLELDLACRAASSQTHSLTLVFAKAYRRLTTRSTNIPYSLTTLGNALLFLSSPVIFQSRHYQARLCCGNVAQPSQTTATTAVSPQSAPTPAQARRLIHTATEESTSRLWAFNAATPHTHL
jgi:hypothetical protein